MKYEIHKIVSGGQTGVDQGALDAAIRLGIPHGGWCPLGRICESGEIPTRFHLAELETPDYAARTRQNVLDSDGTLIICRSKMTGGTLLTYRLADSLDRPCIVVRLDEDRRLDEVRWWLEDERIEVINVAGPRESGEPGIADETTAYLIKLFEPSDR